jgi:riboflavin kinase/FMN adenylyltransferase
VIVVRFYRDLFDPKRVGLDRGSYITIGSFDGVHQGHQQLISSIVKEGANNNSPAIVITFDPLPKQFLGNPESKCIRLTSSRTRAERIASIGVDILLEYTFDQSFSEISADEFIDRILLNLNPKKILIGKDFRFGYKGSGDVTLLLRKGLEFGFETEVLDFVDLGQERISSTRVRKAIEHGNLTLASELMGNEHEIRGRIRKGINENAFFVPHSEVMLPPSGDYVVIIQNANKKHLTKAKILEANRSIEIDLDKLLVNPFIREEVVFHFAKSAQEISEFKEEEEWTQNNYYRSI